MVFKYLKKAGKAVYNSGVSGGEKLKKAYEDEVQLRKTANAAARAEREKQAVRVAVAKTKIRADMELKRYKDSYKRQSPQVFGVADAWNTSKKKKGYSKFNVL